MSCEKSVVVSVELFISFSETECILIYVDLKIIHDPVNFKIIIKVRLQVLKQLLIRRADVYNEVSSAYRRIVSFLTF